MTKKPHFSWTEILGYLALFSTALILAGFFKMIDTAAPAYPILTKLLLLGMVLPTTHQIFRLMESDYETPKEALIKRTLPAAGVLLLCLLYLGNQTYEQNLIFASCGIALGELVISIPKLLRIYRPKLA